MQCNIFPLTVHISLASKIILISKLAAIQLFQKNWWLEGKSKVFLLNLLLHTTTITMSARVITSISAAVASRCNAAALQFRICLRTVCAVLSSHRDFGCPSQRSLPRLITVTTSVSCDLLLLTSSIQIAPMIVRRTLPSCTRRACSSFLEMFPASDPYIRPGRIRALYNCNLVGHESISFLHCLTSCYHIRVVRFPLINSETGFGFQG